MFKLLLAWNEEVTIHQSKGLNSLYCLISKFYLRGLNENF